MLRHGPSLCAQVRQEELERHDGVPSGKYTIGLGQQGLSFVGESLWWVAAGGGGSCGTGVAGQQERHGDREGGGAGGDLHANPRPPQQLSHPPAPPCAPLPPPGDREDPVSMALTVTQQLLDRHGISPLEVRCGALLWAAICSCRRISDGQQHLQQ